MTTNCAQSVRLCPFGMEAPKNTSDLSPRPCDGRCPLYFADDGRCSFRVIAEALSVGSAEMGLTMKMREDVGGMIEQAIRQQQHDRKRALDM